MELKQGDIFESDCLTLVNPVNCEGASGKGLAEAFAERFPELDNIYERVCWNNQLEPGKILVCRSDGSHDHDVLYFPTKDSWREDSKLSYIEEGLAALKEGKPLQRGGSVYWVRPMMGPSDQWDLDSIAFPALGCGLGGLDFDDVRPLIEDFAESVQYPVELYKPR